MRCWHCFRWKVGKDSAGVRTLPHFVVRPTLTRLCSNFDSEIDNYALKSAGYYTAWKDGNFAAVVQSPTSSWIGLIRLVWVLLSVALSKCVSNISVKWFWFLYCITANILSYCYCTCSWLRPWMSRWYDISTFVWVRKPFQCVGYSIGQTQAPQIQSR